MVEKASADYAKLFQSISVDKEVDPICMNIEDMLARLDELETLLANVKAENNIIVDQHTNNIVGFVEEFRVLKERIDKLEHFVDVVNNNVNEVEKSLDIAENELNINEYSLKNLIFKPLRSKSKSSNSVPLDNSNVETIISSNMKNNEFQPIKIFKTDDYFK
uniref:Biogenesis of lysosome-related organelles complex 1 subunit 4 n=1 Tax=Glossina brevipalpis TaxID=37001 RepID=A0A1A9WPZ2_9MUSC